ncbi:MAG: PIN domain-containing protein [Nitrososphaeraceae archaeon]
MNILCDTSFLMVLVTKPIKLLDSIVIRYGKINFLVPDVVIDELKIHAKKRSYKRSQIAKTVLEVTKRFEIVNTSKSNYTDDSIIDYAINYKCAVVTMDKNLIKRLISSKVMVFSLRNNKLIIMNP